MTDNFLREKVSEITGMLLGTYSDLKIFLYNPTFTIHAALAMSSESLSSVSDWKKIIIMNNSIPFFMFKALLTLQGTRITAMKTTGQQQK